MPVVWVGDRETPLNNFQTILEFTEEPWIRTVAGEPSGCLFPEAVFILASENQTSELPARKGPAPALPTLCLFLLQPEEPRDVLGSGWPQSGSCSSSDVFFNAALSTAEQSRPYQLLLHLSYCSVQIF